MDRARRIELDGKIWSDARGWGINPLEVAGLSGKPVYHFHTVSMQPGALRGNHSHEGATEWLLVCGGPAKLAWRTGRQAPVHEFLVDKDAPAFSRPLVLSMGLLPATPALAQDGRGRPPVQGPFFTDRDGNGVCDRWEHQMQYRDRTRELRRDSDGDGIPNGQDEDYTPPRDERGYRR